MVKKKKRDSLLIQSFEEYSEGKPGPYYKGYIDIPILRSDDVKIPFMDTYIIYNYTSNLVSMLNMERVADKYRFLKGESRYNIFMIFRGKAIRQYIDKLSQTYGVVVVYSSDDSLTEYNTTKVSNISDIDSKCDDDSDVCTTYKVPVFVHPLLLIKLMFYAHPDLGKEASRVLLPYIIDRLNNNKISPHDRCYGSLWAHSNTKYIIVNELDFLECKIKSLCGLPEDKDWNDAVRVQIERRDRIYNLIADYVSLTLDNEIAINMAFAMFENQNII